MHIDWVTWSIWLVGFVILVIWIIVPLKEFVAIVKAQHGEYKQRAAGVDASRRAAGQVGAAGGDAKGGRKDDA